MFSNISNWCSTHKAAAYSLTATISGMVAITARNSGTLFFPLTIIATLSASQAAIHVGKENLHCLYRGEKAFNPVSFSLVIGGTIAIPITIGWGIWSIFGEAEKMKYTCLLITSLAVSKLIGIPEFP